MIIKSENIISNAFSLNNWKSFAILIIGIALTFVAAFYTKRDLEKHYKQEFAQVCNEIKAKINTRLFSHAQLLRNGSSFFAASDSITRQEWKQFYENSKVDRNLPGIQGFGFTIIIPKNKLQKHIQDIQKEGFPNYTVRPAGDREIYTSIVFLEPFADRNLRAFGYDMYSEPVRKKAMEQARDYDVAALSGKVILVQETDKDLQAGTLMYVPVYRKGMPANTIEERRAAIMGWVYSPYRMHDLMSGILGRWDELNENRIRLYVYDDESITQNSLLFDSQVKDTIIHNDNPNQTLAIPIVFNNKVWTLLFTQSNEQNLYFQSKVFIVLVSGLLISFLLFSLSLALFNTRIRAQKIAKKLTADLVESEKRFENYINSTSDVVFALDTEQRHVGIYGDWAERAGLSKQIFLGKTSRELFGENAIIHEQANQRALKGEHIVYQWNSVTGNTTTYYQTSLSPLYKENQITGLIGIGRDISELKNKEIALQESEERWKFAINGAQDGLWDWNMETNQVYFSEQWKAMLGFEEHEIGSNLEEWSKRVHPDDLKNCNSDVQLHLDGKVDFYSNIHRVLCKNGSYKWILDRGKIVKYSESGKPIRMIGTHTDLTERINMEKQLEELNSDKDRFISILAHDLRSPFSSILGYLDILTSDIRKYDIDKIETLINIINNSVKTTFYLLEDILMWVKANSGKIPFEPQKMNFSTVLAEIIENLKFTADTKGVSINYLVDDIYIFADKNMLNTILRNLISNAIKFTHKNGRIDIYTENTQSNVIITVSDNGIGMDTQTVDKLFNNSQTITNKGTANEKGTGLGLLLCKEFVEKHSGKIWVDSKIGKGSVFRFTMPLCR